MKPVYGLSLVALLVFYSWRRKSLTSLGLVTAGLTATVHALHPWNTPFVLLAVFYLGSQRATKVKHEVKARLTLSATGAEGGEGPRNHVQVLVNSIIATVLILAHTFVLSRDTSESCFAMGNTASDILMVGIVAHYCATAADTYSSELGILAKSKPRLITSLTLRQVPPGTNGGVTMAGLLAGLLGSFTVALGSVLSTPVCSERSSLQDRALWVIALSFWGLMGSVLDSVLGGLFQATVVDTRSGKVIEGSNGQTVLTQPGSSKSSTSSKQTSAGDSTGTDQLNGAGSVTQRGSHATGQSVDAPAGREGHQSRQMLSGRNWLNNNGVNLVQALVMTVGAMGIAQWFWGIDVRELLELLA
ncbi:hypothetical protein N7528_003057 [Penicillium herquei]|nr:hypothetical protein N7528_003057 [Penicillium herquei]